MYGPWQSPGFTLLNVLRGVAEIDAAAVASAVQDILLSDHLTRLRGLWLQMLLPDPAGRPSVQEALAHEVWQEVEGTTRGEGIEEPDGRVKRVRLLSPEGGGRLSCGSSVGATDPTANIANRLV